MAAALTFALAPGATVAQAAEALPSWNNGKTEQAILAFVKQVTAKGGAEFVPPAACIHFRPAWCPAPGMAGCDREREKGDVAGERFLTGSS